jgi:hypothetical protein
LCGFIQIVSAFYNDQNSSTSGLGDYAVITDFQFNQDVIQLAGTASDYILQSSPISLGTTAADTGIYLKNSGVDELIGIVQDVSVSSLNLNSNSFTFV